MADASTSFRTALQGADFEGDEFSSLLNKEFKPKTDEAKTRSNRRSPWRSRPWSTPTDRQRRAQVDRGDDRRDRQASSPSRSTDHAPRGLPEAGRRLARPALPRQQHRDRRDAEDPRPEHLQEGPGKTLKRFKGTAGTRARSSRRSTKRSTASSAASPSAAWWATTTSTTPARTSSCSAKWPRSRPRRTAPFIAARPPTLMQMDSWQELANPRDLTKIFTRPNTPPGARCASPTTRATSAWPCRASCRACPTARRPTRSRSSTSRKTPGRRSQQVHLGQRRLCDGGEHQPLVQAVRLVHAHPRHRIRRRGRGLPVHTFPTDDGGVDMKCPTEIAISDRREAELAKNGFMPLVHRKNSDFAAFIGAQSLQKPAEYDDPDATANANLAARCRTCSPPAASRTT
jgi:type VI secretion system protein ImpC